MACRSERLGRQLKSAALVVCGVFAAVGCKPNALSKTPDPAPSTLPAQSQGAAGQSSVAAAAAAPGSPAAPTFSEIYRDLIMAKGCLVGACHGGPAGGLSMRSEELAYANLVGVSAMGRSSLGSHAPNCADSGLKRVVPGNPDASLLVKKIEHTQPCGAAMPAESVTIPGELSLRVRAWIAAGALNPNGASAPPPSMPTRDTSEPDAGIELPDSGATPSMQRPPDAAIEPTGGANAPAFALCTGCPNDVRDASDTQLRVHHVHLNVRDARQAIDFYVKFFGAKPVRINGQADALWAEPLLFLLHEVTYPLPDSLQVGFEHVGMGTADPAAWFDMARQQGIQADPRNGAPETPTTIPTLGDTSRFVDPSGNSFTFIYVQGPNHERIEVWSGLAKFRHAHFMTPDVATSVDWYAQLLGVPTVFTADVAALAGTNAVELDGVQLNFLSPLEAETFVETDMQPVGHIALSVPNLDAMFAKAKQGKIQIVSEPALTPEGFRSFFVRAPEKVLLEFVEAGPVRVP
jgi:catechol 2,3-dioxygenase-like lactoylglutathione lyase family enzyme